MIHIYAEFILPDKLRTTNPSEAIGSIQQNLHSNKWLFRWRNVYIPSTNQPCRTHWLQVHYPTRYSLPYSLFITAWERNLIICNGCSTWRNGIENKFHTICWLHCFKLYASTLRSVPPKTGGDHTRWMVELVTFPHRNCRGLWGGWTQMIFFLRATYHWIHWIQWRDQSFSCYISQTQQHNRIATRILLTKSLRLTRFICDTSLQILKWDCIFESRTCLPHTGQIRSRPLTPPIVLSADLVMTNDDTSTGKSQVTTCCWRKRANIRLWHLGHSHTGGAAFHDDHTISTTRWHHLTIFRVPVFPIRD